MKSDFQNSWIKELKQVISPIHTAMLTTYNGKIMSSRPMLTMEMDENGELWFFASSLSAKVENIQKDSMVNVVYTDADKQVFVSITGTAFISNSKYQIEKFWKPVFRTWFEKGRHDPSLILINIKINYVEYWDASAYKMRNMIHLFGAFITGNPIEMASEHNIIELS